MKKILFLIINIAFMVAMISACSTPPGSPAIIEKSVEEKQPVQAFGVVMAQNIQDISFNFPVKVKKLLVQEGQVVTGGGSLAIIDMAAADDAVMELEEQVEALRLETSYKQKVLARKKESVSKNSDPEVLKLENAMRRTKEEYDSLLSENTGKLSLLDAGALSEQEYLDHLKILDAAEYSFDNAELTLKSFTESKKEEMLQADAAIAENLLKISALEKKLQNSRERLSSEYLKGDEIISVIPKGIIFSIDCKSGETVPAGRKLFSIMDASSLIIEANVDEQFIKDVKLGAGAYITPESDLEQEYRGKVTAISAFAVQQNSETVIPVQISLDKQYDGIYPGYNMEVTIETE